MAKTEAAVERKATTYIVLRQIDGPADAPPAWEEIGSYSALNNELAKRMAAGDLLNVQGGEFPQGAVTLVAVPATSFKPTTGRIEVAQPRLVMSAA